MSIMPDVGKTAEISANTEPVKKDHIVLLVLTFLFGILFDSLIINTTPGISYFIFVSAYYGIVLWYMRKNLKIEADFGWLLTIPVVLLALTYTIHSNQFLHALNFMAVPVLLMVQSLLITRNSKSKWYEAGIIADILRGFFIRTFGNMIKPFSLMKRLLNSKKNESINSTLKKVFIGLFAAIPILLVILSLLASADAVFEHYLGVIPDIFQDLNIGELIPRGIAIFFAFTLSFGYIWSLSEQRADAEKKVDAQAAKNYRVGDPVIIITILSLVDIIYVLFSAIQFSYLFGGMSSGLPAEFTYAEYARRGFFELVVVTLLNFAILLGSLSFTKKSSRKISVTLSVLNTLLVGCTLIVLLSAHFRMYMYEEAYGYTYLRMFTHIFMAVLFVLLLMSLYRIWNEKFTLAKPYIVVCIAALILVNYMNVDVIIARNNVNRHFNAKQIDLDYLGSLSYDAAPQIARLLDSQDRIVAEQANNLLYDMREELSAKRSWKSFNISKYRAYEYLKTLDLKYTN